MAHADLDAEPDTMPLADPAAALRQMLVDMARARRGTPRLRAAGDALWAAISDGDWRLARVRLRAAWPACVGPADALLTQAGVPPDIQTSWLEPQ